MRIGIIGLGRMGGPIALHLSQAHQVTVLPPRGGYDGPLPCAADVRSLADAEAIVTVLRSSDEVAALMPDLLAGARPGLLHIDHCSGDPARSEGFARAWQARGCGYVDAALSGTPELAAQGRLKLLCGGTAPQIARLRKIAAPYAADVIHAGPTGRGHMLRLIAGLMGYGIAALSAEILLAAEQAGIDPDHVHRTITGTGADSRTFQAVHARTPRPVPIAAVRRELASLPDLGPMLAATRSVYAQARPDAPISDLVQALKDPQHE